MAFSAKIMEKFQIRGLVYKSDAYPTVLSGHMLTVSYFQILIQSGSAESRNDPSPKSEVVHETKFILKISHSTEMPSCLYMLPDISSHIPPL